MERLLIALAIVALAGVLSSLVRRRRRVDPPTQSRRELPSQIDRSDFDGDRWLVAVFTSDSCNACADVVRKAEVLHSDEVAVVTASFQTRKDLHERYESERGIEIARNVHRAFGALHTRRTKRGLR